MDFIVALDGKVRRISTTRLKLVYSALVTSVGFAGLSTIQLNLGLLLMSSNTNGNVLHALGLLPKTSTEIVKRRVNTPVRRPPKKRARRDAEASTSYQPGATNPPPTPPHSTFTFF